jgi:hypothetical protein
LEYELEDVDQRPSLGMDDVNNGDIDGFAAMAEFIEFSKHRHYHEGIGNVTLADVDWGGRHEILKRRKGQEQGTIDARFPHNLGQASNQTRGELGTEL